MSIKEQVLAELAKHKSEPVSGALLAEKFHVSRTSIWKSIQTLKKEGYGIEGQTKTGYTLVTIRDRLSDEALKKYTYENDYHFCVFDQVTSTNDLAKIDAQDGAPDWTVLLANEQTKGRGRQGHQFYSPSDSGVYFSVILRPKMAGKDALLITVSAAVAMAQAITSCTGRTPEIKWVNDLYLDGRKVCGILTEASMDFETMSVNYIVLGIGVNIAQPDGGFPLDIQHVAGVIGTDHTGDFRSRLVAVFLNYFRPFYEDLGKKDFVPYYQKHAYLTGKEVDILQGETVIGHGIVLGVDDECRLLVRYDDGSEKALSSGDVRVKIN